MTNREEYGIIKMVGLAVGLCVLQRREKSYVLEC